MTIEIPENVSKTPVVDVKENKTQNNTRGPADDLKDIQVLLVSGIFPGNMAPLVVKAYSVLEQMVKGAEALLVKCTGDK